MLIGPLRDAVTVVKVVHSLSDSYAALVVTLYEGGKLIGSFQTRCDAIIRGRYKLATAHSTLRFAARGALAVFLRDHAERPVTVRIIPILAPELNDGEMNERLDRVMMVAAWLKDAARECAAREHRHLGDPVPNHRDRGSEQRATSSLADRR